jgi:hypothetical protein
MIILRNVLRHGTLAADRHRTAGKRAEGAAGERLRPLSVHNGDADAPCYALEVLPSKITGSIHRCVHTSSSKACRRD